jgi:hypothetical protein
MRLNVKLGILNDTPDEQELVPTGRMLIPTGINDSYRLVWLVNSSVTP